MKKKKKIVVLISILIVLIFAGILCYPFLKMVFRLDFSQDYRKIVGAEEIIFQDRTAPGNSYCRGTCGLKRISPEKAEELEAYDANTDICEADGALIEKLRTENTVEQIVISPDEQYILYQEIEYGYSGGYTSDDEYCYYRVVSVDSGEIVTIYQGYREWYELSW